MSISGRNTRDSSRAIPPSAPMLAANAGVTVTTKVEKSAEKIRFVDLSLWQKAEQAEKITVEKLNDRIRTRAQDSKMHIRIGDLSTLREAPQVKEITVGELNQITGTQVSWSNTHIQVSDDKSLADMMSEEDLKLYPPITKEKFGQIMAEVIESSQKFALTRHNPVHGFSTITTESIEPYQGLVLFVGKLERLEQTEMRKSQHNLVISSDRKTQIDATGHRGYANYMMDAPLPSQLPPSVAQNYLHTAYSISDYKCKEPEKDIVTVNLVSFPNDRFSFEGVPYVIFRNFVRIPAFHFLAIPYGRDFFITHEMLPRLCLKIGGGLLTEDNFQAFAIKFPIKNGVVCSYSSDENALKEFFVPSTLKRFYIDMPSGAYIKEDRLKQIITEMLGGERKDKTKIKQFYSVDQTDVFFEHPSNLIAEEQHLQSKAASLYRTDDMNSRDSKSTSSSSSARDYVETSFIGTPSSSSAALLPLLSEGMFEAKQRDQHVLLIEPQVRSLGLKKYSYRDWAFYLFCMYPPGPGIKPHVFTVPVASLNASKEDKLQPKLMQKIEGSTLYQPSEIDAETLVAAARKNLLSPHMLNVCARRTAPLHTRYHQEIKHQLLHIKRKIYLPREGVDKREFKVRLEDHIHSLYPHAERRFFRHYAELFRPANFIFWSQTAFFFLDRLASTVTQDHNTENEKLIAAALAKIVMLILLTRGWMPPWRMYEQHSGAVIYEFSIEFITLFFEQGFRDPLLLIEANSDVQVQLMQKNPWAYILALESRLQYIEDVEQKACLVELIEYAKNKEIKQEIMQLGIDTHIEKTHNHGTDPGNLWLLSPPPLKPDQKAVSTTTAISSSVALQGLFATESTVTVNPTVSSSNATLPPCPQH